MKAYTFSADIYCEPCSEAIKEQLGVVANEAQDSNVWPQGPFEDGGGEADCPQHCGSCGVFLENPLTDDGDAYVRQAAAEFENKDSSDQSWEEVAHAAETVGRHDLAKWIRFYFAEGQ